VLVPIYEIYGILEFLHLVEWEQQHGCEHQLADNWDDTIACVRRDRLP
jgi:hypothetical protein